MDIFFVREPGRDSSFDVMMKANCESTANQPENLLFLVCLFAKVLAVVEDRIAIFVLVGPDSFTLIHQLLVFGSSVMYLGKLCLAPISARLIGSFQFP